MNIRNIYRILYLSLFLNLTFEVCAEDQDQLLISSVNSNWVARNYIQILNSLNDRLQVNSNDVLALNLKMDYFMFCEMNISNVHENAVKFTNVVNSSDRKELIPRASLMAERYLAIPLTNAPFEESITNMLHADFSESFPGIEEYKSFSYEFNRRVDLHVCSQFPTNSVMISINPLDRTFRGDDLTAFDRVYINGATVSLAAPNYVGSNTFSHWNENGFIITTNISVTITISNRTTMTAVYSPN